MIIEYARESGWRVGKMLQMHQGQHLRHLFGVDGIPVRSKLKHEKQHGTLCGNREAGDAVLKTARSLIQLPDRRV
jgi:hypothetical protein